MVYTAAIWHVKPGREEEFLKLWQSLGARTVETFPQASGTLLRARERPQRFLSFGPWDSIEQVDKWRSSPAFQETVRDMQEVLESFEPATWDVTARVRQRS